MSNDNTDRCLQCGYKGPHRQEKDGMGEYKRCGNCGVRLSGLGILESRFPSTGDKGRSDYHFSEGDKLYHEKTDKVATVKEKQETGYRIRATDEDQDALVPWSKMDQFRLHVDA